METIMILTQPKANVSHNTLDNDSNNNLTDFFAFCQNHFGIEIYKKWFTNIEIFSHSNSEIIIKCPSKFERDWLNREFFQSKVFKNSLHKKLPQLLKVSAIFVAKEEDSESSSRIDKSSKSPSKILNLSKYQNIFAFGTELNSKYIFENFVSTKYNKMALSMAKIVAGIGDKKDLFKEKIPFFIHGSVGMGKTHLAQAIAWQIQNSDSSKKVVYLSAEKFMYHFVQSIRSNDVMSFKEKMRSIDVLIVDDVQFIAGKESTQQEFMNCFNSLVEDNKQVVLVCDRCPLDLEKIDEKLKSRISGGMIVNFKNTDFSDRLEIVKSKASQLDVELCSKVLNFVAENIKTSIRDLDGALKKLVASQVFGEEEITLETAKNILSSYIKNSKQEIVTIEKIQKIVAEFYNIKISELNSASRVRNIARPRQIAMYLSKKYTQESLTSIGEKFGKKNHATVIHSEKQVIAMLDNNKILEEIKTIEEKISSK
jgi:chromosomal replication initiator protein